MFHDFFKTIFFFLKGNQTSTSSFKCTQRDSPAFGFVKNSKPNWNNPAQTQKDSKKLPKLRMEAEMDLSLM